MRWQFGVAVVLAILVAPAAARADWVTFSSDEGRFTAVMPVSPELEAQTAEAQDGSIIGTSHVFRAEDTDLKLICMAGYVDYARPVEIEGVFAATQDTFVKATHATVTASRRTTFARSPTDLLPSIEFSASTADQVFSFRLMVDGQRVYTIGGAYAPPSNPSGPADAKRCIDGFKLTP